MSNPGYYWYSEAPEGEYAILRVYTEGQVHLEDHLEMLRALNEAYTRWCQLHIWTEAARQDFRRQGPFPFDHPRFRYLERWLRRRFDSGLEPYYEELAALLLASRSPETGRSLSESILSIAVDPRNRAILHRCELASPGSIDIAGVGKALEVVKDWITGRGLRKAQERETNAKARKTEAEARAQELENLETEVRLAKEFRNAARDLGYSPTEIQGALTGDLPKPLQALNPIVDRGQIRGAEILPIEQGDEG